MVSIKHVMHSKRKLKSNGLLRLCIASKGVLTVSDFIASFSDNKTDKQDSSFIEYLLIWIQKVKDVAELLNDCNCSKENYHSSNMHTM